MAKKYLIETFGCQMNVHDSERMAGLLDQAGYEPTADDLDADVIVINTCSVREHAEEKLYTRLGELRVMGEETGRRPLVVVFPPTWDPPGGSDHSEFFDGLDLLAPGIVSCAHWRAESDSPATVPQFGAVAITP